MKEKHVTVKSLKLLFNQSRRDMKEKLKAKLEEEGRSLKWFHKNFMLESTYNTMALQLNGYATISDDLKNAVNEYLNNNGQEKLLQDQSAAT